MVTIVRRRLMSPLVRVEVEGVDAGRSPLSARYIVAPSGLQPMPLEMVRPVSTVVQLPSSSSR